MYLNKLIENLTNISRIKGSLDLNISGIDYDSRQVKAGHLFIAMQGLVSDGHHYIEAAVQAGAIAIIYDRPEFSITESVTAIRVNNSRLALPDLAAVFFMHPENKLKLIGITGTNGKTTTNYFIQHLLTETVLKTGRIGTTGAKMNPLDIDLIHTTPESADLYEILAKFVKHGAKAATLEVSSHALSQNRINGLNFDIAVYTNLTQDHLDYHGSFEEYLAAKQLLFKGLAKDSTAVINTDDPFSERIIEVCTAKIVRYGYNAEAEYRILDHTITHGGVKLKLKTPYGQRRLQVNTVGSFNYYNFLAAYAVAVELQAPIDAVDHAARTLPAVPGRLEKMINTAPFMVFIDYAHTPDAMETLLQTLIETYPNRRIISVFGCGGDRDQGKRPIMGAIACRLSTRAIITDDNPRSESPEAIIEAIATGCRHRSNFQIIQDRFTAVTTALENAVQGDIVAILGKGHESYQEIHGKRKPYSDLNTVNQFMEQHGYSV